MHPLIDNLRDLTDDELNRKISDLYNRIRFFSRTGNVYAYQQACALYTEYREEADRRMRVANEELLKAAGDDFNDRIDIN